MISWSYGVTTVPSRFEDLLPRTLESLKKAGFDNPRLFVDGNSLYKGEKGYRQSVRDEPIEAFGNWILGLYELYIREPNAHRYAIFQDDFVAYKNLRCYLDKQILPRNGYWNLFTFRDNEEVIKGTKTGWHEGVYRHSDLGLQAGRGAVALVFSRGAVRALLRSPIIVNKPCTVVKPTQSIDGVVVEAMNAAGYLEYVHNPSLVQHTGVVSAMKNKIHTLDAKSWLGEEFDAKSFYNDEVAK